MVEWATVAVTIAVAFLVIGFGFAVAPIHADGFNCGTAFWDSGTNTAGNIKQVVDDNAHGTPSALYDLTCGPKRTMRQAAVGACLIPGLLVIIAGYQRRKHDATLS
jgi:hypothetical protein